MRDTWMMHILGEIVDNKADELMSIKQEIDSFNHRVVVPRRLLIFSRNIMKVWKDSKRLTFKPSKLLNRMTKLS